ncbi:MULTISPECIES: ThiF family adenylyltransferase [Planktothricoides]|uniref:ThiF family adenylyltransferase n=2 Tax=Planktothricoides raciborskii TaxID=132608 RepID=A0AAU8JH90_9CYAN|nr:MULTISPECIES: ThiF family adenylyltransferase [Planktothricoides]KOR35191.1 thiamine biosynthesis protein ThiF [Planktothricoides sp. SR001]MBD2546189.1 ThiF family adenylyltransferase [Planktothricoides raciborskii FACHB-1370]MBD2583813.1 ThiF family adenylyltransferase [Planktothricoides raciborskii FACHB-1261]
MSIFFHEQIYRTSEVMAKLKTLPVTVCGAGALGANLTESLARSGFSQLKTIDRDRIEERNLSTQPYYRSDIGAFKAKILANSLYRALGVKLEIEAKELTPQNAKQLISKPGLVIDTFDNSISRQAVKDYCTTNNIPCLHLGMASDYAEIIWNQDYRVPSPTNDDICEYPLARNLVTLTVAVACEVIINFTATEKQQSFTVTLGDFAIKPFLAAQS